jgi:hypothetical protein
VHRWKTDVWLAPFTDSAQNHSLLVVNQIALLLASQASQASKQRPGGRYPGIGKTRSCQSADMLISQPRKNLLYCSCALSSRYIHLPSTLAGCAAAGADEHQQV